jgi:hypothetical protein
MPTVADLQAIWSFTYSRSSLLEAKNFLAEVSDVAPDLNQVTPESLRYRALVYAVITAYARPFTTCRIPPNRQFKPLDNVPPPQELAQFHDDALILRNTMIGHSDATPAKGYTASPNMVVVRIYPDNKFSLHSVTLGEMEPPMKKALPELCDHFVLHCDANLSRLMKPYRSELMNRPPGRYELVIAEPPADWIVPFKPKHGDDFRAPSP